MRCFKDRNDAGKQLRQPLKKYEGSQVVVYALPRGGVVVADEIAKFLNAPLDLILAHKIGHPYQPEYAVAAVSESGHLIISSREGPHLDKKWLEGQKKLEMLEIKRKRLAYLAGKKEISIKDKIAIIVDDGIATGLTMLAAIEELRGRQPRKIVVAVPVSPLGIAEFIKEKVDDFVGIEVPEDSQFLGGVGSYYEEFGQVSDAEVMAILNMRFHW